MATSLQSVCLSVRAGHRPILSHACAIRSSSRARLFHITSSRNRGNQDEDGEKKVTYRAMIKRKEKPKVPRPSQIDAPRASSTRQLIQSFDFEDDEVKRIIMEDEGNEYNTLLKQYGTALSPEKPEDYDHFLRSAGRSRQSQRRLPTDESQMAGHLKDQEKFIRTQQRYLESQNPNEIQLEEEKPGFVSTYDGKDDPAPFGDEIFEADDMTPIGHGYLEEHRDIREYYRLAAWELPLLTQYAKPFEPPSSENPLRFRYTSYLGEAHPSEKKVVVEFCTADLPLEPKQRHKLVKLLGTRYNPQKDLAKISCESFPEPAQNKRYLSDLVDNLLSEARSQSDAEHGKDAFDDVPADFRHVKYKRQPKFPDAWKMTPDRRAKLFQGWTAEIGRSQQAMIDDSVVDGVKTIAQVTGAQPVKIAASQPVRVR